jgi:sulfur carrier protein ThiS
MGSIKVAATGPLKENVPEGAAVSPGLSVAQALESMELNIRDGVLALVNNHAVGRDHVLREGDRFELVQVVGGGS